MSFIETILNHREMILNTLLAVLLIAGLLLLALVLNQKREIVNLPVKFMKGDESDQDDTDFNTRLKLLRILGFTLTGMGILGLTVVQFVLPLTNPPTAQSWSDKNSGEVILSQNGQYFTANTVDETLTYLVKKGAGDTPTPITVSMSEVTVLQEPDTTARFVTQTCELVGAENSTAFIWKSGCGTRQAIVVPGIDNATLKFGSNNSSGGTGDDFVNDLKTSGRQLTPAEIKALQDKDAVSNPAENNSPHAPVEPGRESFHGGDQAAPSE